jgi:endoglycosylceramidase
MPWTEWAYCACGDPTTSASPPDAEGVVHDPSKPPTGANVAASTLRALARPFPWAVAGTPQLFGFNPKTGVFQLRFSTVRPNRHGRFRAGSCTKVLLPALQYPHGYRVRLHGGHRISAGGAGVLEVASLKGAKTITVTVTRTKNGETSPPRLTHSCAAR